MLWLCDFYCVLGSRDVFDNFYNITEDFGLSEIVFSSLVIFLCFKVNHSVHEKKHCTSRHQIVSSEMSSPALAHCKMSSAWKSSALAFQTDPRGNAQTFLSHCHISDSPPGASHVQTFSHSPRSVLSRANSEPWAESELENNHTHTPTQIKNHFNVKLDLHQKGMRRVQLFKGADGDVHIRAYTSPFTPEERQRLLNSDFGVFGQEFEKAFENGEFDNIRSDALSDVARDLIGETDDSCVSSPIRSLCSVFFLQ